MTHTPGPWRVKGIRSVVADKTHICANGETMSLPNAVVCTVDNHDREANARLIAAAPALLEALEAVVKLSPGQTVENIAREAIAQATGDKS